MKRFRFLAVVLALCLCLCGVVPSAAATDKDPNAYYPIAYSQTATLQLGDRVYITGTPNYDAYTSNESTTLLAVDTAEGTWFVAIGPVSVAAFKAGVPSGEITLLGIYAGTMNTNGMPILDIQQGFYGRYENQYGPYGPYGTYATVRTFVTTSTSDVLAAGQKVLDQKAAEAQAEAEAEAARKAQEEAEKAAEAAAWQKTGKMVWIPTRGGHCYHTNPHCSGMIDPEKVDLGYAKYLGYRDCSKC